MSLYEFNAALSEYSRIKSGKVDPMTDGEVDELLDELRALNMKDMKI